MDFPHRVPVVLSFARVRVPTVWKNWLPAEIPRILRTLVSICLLVYAVPGLAAETRELVAVQVGVYEEPANAKRMVARLERANFPVVTDSFVDNRGRPLIGVMVGPYETSERALSVKSALSARGWDGVIRTYRAPMFAHEKKEQTGSSAITAEVTRQVVAPEHTEKAARGTRQVEAVPEDDIDLTEDPITPITEQDVDWSEAGIAVPTPSEDALIVALLERGRRAYQEGDSTQAVLAFAQAIQHSKEQGNVARRIDALMFMSDAYEAVGMNAKAIAALDSALSLAKKGAETAFPDARFPEEPFPDAHRLASLFARLGRAYQTFGRYGDASNFLRNGIEIADTAKHPDLLAVLWNDLGNASISSTDFSTAIDAFERSETLAKDNGNDRLAARAGINLSRARIENGVDKDLVANINDNIRATQAISDPRQQAENFLAICDLVRTAQKKFDGPASWRKSAHDVCRKGLALAEEMSDQRLASYALGYLGALYGDEGRYAQAVEYTQRAAFAAQEVNAYESLYRWEWQTARLLRAQGNTEEAIIAYRQAVKTLQEIRADLSGSSGPTFRQLVGPVFFELADILLERTATLEDQEAIQRNLSVVRDTLEQVKVAEIEDYFQHECVLPVEKTTRLDQLAADSAVMYPVLLPDRVEILLSLPDGLQQFTSVVGIKELTEEVRKFRESIETDSKDELYLRYGKNLHDWLIAPLEKTLQKHDIRTLVFIPDGPLRSIPIAALYDGEKFLIEKYAVATTLGLTLTSPKPIVRENVQVLLTGISESVQGFAALPNVENELARIEELYPSNVFKDKDFVLATAEKEMSEGTYSIVHIASHGQFDSDHRKSFLLTYDDKLTMNRLEQTIGLRRFQEEPLELLVLSACQTAAGDDRAALGLAGIALKAGARSALATLWFINDEATSVLVADFYHQLQDQGISKAEALQEAQVGLIGQEQYGHPSLWAPFLLLGNWL